MTIVVALLRQKHAFRLIGESLTIELALDRLTKEHPDGQGTGIRADGRALEGIDGENPLIVRQERSSAKG